VQVSNSEKLPESEASPAHGPTLVTKASEEDNTKDKIGQQPVFNSSMLGCAYETGNG
jgi:hypothetical protein